MSEVAWLGYAATFCFVAVVWYAAVRFGRDSRDGEDWQRHRPR